MPCKVCGSTVKEQKDYKQLGLENCPSNCCRVCWYKYGRMIGKK